MSALRFVFTHDIADGRNRWLGLSFYFKPCGLGRAWRCAFCYSLEHQLPPYRTGTVIESGTSAAPVAGIQR